MTVTEIAPSSTVSYPADEVIDALIAGVVRVRRRAEIYEYDGVTPFNVPNWNARLTGGNITVDRTRDERRVVELYLENNDNALKIDPVNGFWYDKIIKVFWGIKYYDRNGQPAAWESQIGEFMIDGIDNPRFPHNVKVTGRDYTKRCLVSTIANSIQFPQHTPIEDIIRALAANCGIRKMALPITGQSYNTDLVYERNTARWKVMTQIADSIGYEIYFRGDGYLTMRPYPDPTTSPLAWVFRGGPLDGTLIDYTRSSTDASVKNHVRLIGASNTVDGFTQSVFAEAINNDPNSPTRVDRIGDRVDQIENALFTTQAQGQDFVNMRLRVSALEEWNLPFESLIIPWIEAGDIIDIDNSEGSVYVPSRFLLSDFNFPLNLGKMTGTGKRVTIVGSNQTVEYQ